LIEERDLDAAVAAGILDAATRERLVVFTRDLRRGTAGPDEEQFRLLTGFNDIFVSIAIGLLLVALIGLTGRVAPIIGGAASWALAEYFTRRRRMALPSILLLLSFVGAAFGLGLMLAGGVDDMSFSVAIGAANGSPDKTVTKGFGLPLASCLAAAAAIAHWWRFKVPITIAAGAGALALLVIVLVGGAVTAVAGAPAVNLVVAGCGIAIFALAMWFDSRDLARVTRRSDVAFWLHLLAAPMIIHPVFALTGLATGKPGAGAALAVVLVYLGLTALAVAIDRRALLVSALGYVIYAINALVGRGDDFSAGLGVTALVIGLFLVLLSAAWRSVREVVLGMLPANITARLPTVAV
jgi:hypothetical protein